MGDTLSDLRVSNKSRHLQGAIKVCENYGAAWRVDMKHFWEHENHYTWNFVCITERSNMCEGLPFFAFTCKRVLGEMWGWYYSGADDGDSTGDGAGSKKKIVKETPTAIQYQA
jgi:hypothetical protein